MSILESAKIIDLSRDDSSEKDPIPGIIFNKNKVNLILFFSTLYFTVEFPVSLLLGERIADAKDHARMKDHLYA